MEVENFPWLGGEASAPSRPVSAPVEAVNPPLPLWKRLIPYLAFAGLILILLVTRNLGGRDEGPQDPPLEVVVPIFAIAKGEAVPLEALRVLPLERKSFSKKDTLQLVRQEELSRLAGRLSARKNLGPNKPLSWSDLDLKLQKDAVPKPTTVLYPKEHSL